VARAAVEVGGVEHEHRAIARGVERAYERRRVFGRADREQLRAERQEGHVRRARVVDPPRLEEAVDHPRQRDVLRVEERRAGVGLVAERGEVPVRVREHMDPEPERRRRGEPRPQRVDPAQLPRSVPRVDHRSTIHEAAWLSSPAGSLYILRG
jgi:hypothetical protein